MISQLLIRCCAASTVCCAAGNVLLCQSTAELGQLATDTGQSAYRGKQLYDGLMHGARKLDEINNVSFRRFPTLSCN